MSLGFIFGPRWPAFADSVASPASVFKLPSIGGMLSSG